MTKNLVSQTSIIRTPILCGEGACSRRAAKRPQSSAILLSGKRWITFLRLLRSRAGASSLATEGFPALGHLLQSVIRAMRQLVTRQTTTRFFVANGTTLSTLLDPDQDPPGRCSGGPLARLPALRWLLKKNESEFAALHIRGGSRRRGHKPCCRYYLTEEAICSV